jgi:hypothetical protein
MRMILYVRSLSGTFLLGYRHFFLEDLSGTFFMYVPCTRIFFLRKCTRIIGTSQKKFIGSRMDTNVASVHEKSAQVGPHDRAKS